jgi:hypothetical protein
MKRIALARKEIKVGAFIFEIADSEIDYNKQRQLEHLVEGRVAAMKKVASVQLNKLRANTYSKFKTNYREKKLKEQIKISQLKMAMRSGSIRKVK